MKYTDNSHFAEKVDLRKSHLPKTQIVKVLDCYHGTGKIWEKVQADQPDKQIDVLGIDVKKESKAALIGDNLKFMRGMDLSRFHVIDIDAYGVPFDQLETVFKSDFTGVVFVTFIQARWGGLNNRLLEENEFTKEMINTSLDIVRTNPLEQVCYYLAKRGVYQIDGYFFPRKAYFAFIIP